MPSVLVTGASRGIGRSIVARLASDGWDVFAGVRTDADAAAVSAIPRVRGVLLDVTSGEHVAALADSLPDRLDGVVNNAGIVVGGPLEALSVNELRRQLEVNVIGQLAVTQAVLPRLRHSRGRIVFISSVNGKIATPMIGAYCASKFALEAAADALRMELQPWHIQVSVVEPAQTATDIWDDAERTVEELEAAMTPGQRVLYAKHVAGFRKMIPMSRKLAVPAERVADVVHGALTARRPRARYAVGLGPRLQIALIGNLPTRATDIVLRKAFGQP
ncbi:SDR family NAD(P)-dependent oxidoreductase [Mycolicibacterium komossense]|uniref:SDR family NAD(P)-dependent oxidoreductase n=1 Tax=Mycolicibacterium komossense TaxID=1779 RepID=A0ABT3C8F4_9MYCO|nr:SDR family NAD(P)-dependent oxidoreductase [Mycolicibacterium komossense]MCV7225725.1 SDR family NAD(P)-dependent oxidoreductase [Mycolicibacterium komossense]